jgi:hypothetical protein
MKVEQLMLIFEAGPGELTSFHFISSFEAGFY